MTASGLCFFSRGVSAEVVVIARCGNLRREQAFGQVGDLKSLGNEEFGFPLLHIVLSSYPEGCGRGTVTSNQHCQTFTHSAGKLHQLASSPQLCVAFLNTEIWWS